MGKIHFIGLTISKHINPVLLECFDGSIVEWRKIKSRGVVEFCLFYRGHSCIDKIVNSNIVKLSKSKQQQLINELEMVESKELYNSYNDNFGYHSLEVDPKKIKIAFKKRR